MIESGLTLCKANPARNVTEDDHRPSLSLRCALQASAKIFA